MGSEDPLLEDLMNSERGLSSYALIVLQLASHLATEALIVTHGNVAIGRPADVLQI